MTAVEYNTIGTRLIFIRKILGFRQRDFANAINVTYRTYQRIEKGESELPVQAIINIANQFEIPASVFFSPAISESDENIYEEIKRNINKNTELTINKSLSEYQSYNSIAQELASATSAISFGRNENNFCVTENFLDYANLSKNYTSKSSIENIKKLSYTSVFQNHHTIVNFWETLLRNNKDTRYNISFIDNKISENESIRSISIIDGSDCSIDKPLCRSHHKT